jgi:hypothetical protein
MSEQQPKKNNNNKKNNNRTHIPVQGYKVEDLQKEPMENLVAIVIFLGLLFVHSSS